MPRLTKEQAIDYYGRNLPTPTIDKITLSNLPDSLKEEAIELIKTEDSDFSSEIEVESFLSDVIKVDIDVSFLFSTDEEFNTKDIEKALFDVQKDTDGDDRSLYLTLYTSYDRIRDNESVFKTDIISNFVPSPMLRDMIMSEAYEPGTIDFNRFESNKFFTGVSEAIPLISVPLSDYETVAELTPEMDADGNAVIRIANIKITTYLKDFESQENMNVFCAVSSRHPYEIKTPTSFSLDPITISMNYSDISYETIVKDGKISIIEEPTYVDSNGIQYPNKPMAAINGKYYKTDDFGKKQIANSVLALIGEYKTRAMVDEELQTISDELQTIVVAQQNRIDFLQSLNKAAQGFTATNPVSQAIRFTERLRILINNADAVLRSQEEVVRRVFRNYKIVDSRTVIVSETSAPSFNDSLTDRDFLYQEVFNTNIANYVPMVTAGSDYPGKAELPVSPSEMVGEYKEDITLIREQLQNILVPFSTEGSATAPLLDRINDAIEDTARWCFDGWAGKFIKGSTHEAYQNADGHAGVHYYITPNLFGDDPLVESSRWYWNWSYSKDEYTITEKTRYGEKFYYIEWSKLKDGMAPHDNEVQRWKNLVEGTVGRSGELPKFPWRKTNGIWSGISKDNPDNDSIEGRSPETITNRFGYIPSPDSSRPDNSPPNNGPSYQISWTSAKLPDKYSKPAFSRGEAESDVWEKRTWYWFDPFFWTTVSQEEINGLYSLAQQEEQIEFFVPNKVGVLTEYGDFEWERDGEFTWDPDGEHADMYMSVKYDKVGSVKVLHSNTLSDPYDDSSPSGLRGLSTLDVTSQQLIWWRCARRKYNSIYNKVKEIFYSFYGIDPETLEFVGGTGAISGRPAGEDTNPETDLDRYISEGPYRIVEKVLQDILEKIDSRPADDFDTEAERRVATALYVNELGEKILDEAEAYYTTKGCKIYACTARPARHSVTPFGEPTPGVYGNRFPDVGMKTLERSGNLHGSIAYGVWGPLTLSSGASAEYSEGNVYYKNFGQDLINLLVENFNQNRDEIQQLISNYISRRALFSGFKSDTGIHSALAEIDIVVSKYGYFFFDMEKYIRNNSHLAKVINVDRFMDNFASARFMTNAACNLVEASVELDNFGIDPLTGTSTTTKAAKLTLLKNESDMLTKSQPYNFENMTFESPIEPVTERPLVYRKINALQGISFEQITEFTNDRPIIDSESALAASATATTDPLSGGSSGAPGTIGYISVGGGGETSTTDVPDATLGESLAEARERLMSYEMQIARQEVDIEDLTAPASQYAPKQIHSNLVMRNYAFPGYSNLSLKAGKTWRRDYRMMMFRYQFFVDDDDVFRFSGDPELDDGNVSYDNVAFEIRINDRSEQTYYEIVEQFRVALEYFNDEYVEYAEEACAFNSFDQSFNNFFINQMTDKYPTPPNTPWHKMVAYYIIYRNMLSDEFDGSTLLMFEAGDRILEKIRPETGNLESLRNFYDTCLATLATLEAGEEFLRSEELEQEFVFRYEDVIGAPIIDHIGDYSDRLEDPRISEFGGDEDLYDYEDF